jgi:hypothetical protein
MEKVPGLIENPEDARYAAQAEKPLRDIAREDWVDEDQKSALDILAEQRGEELLQKHLSEKTPESDIEENRERLAEIVKLNLEKYRDEIKDFSLRTTSLKLNGHQSTNNELPPVSYDSRYDSNYIFHNLPRGSNYLREKTPGYVMRLNRYVTFVAPLGRALHTPDRPGNIIDITLLAQQGKNFSSELIDSIENLVETIIPYYNKGTSHAEINDDLKNILKEGLPVLEAFEGISKKFPNKRGNISVKFLIDEYKEMYEKISRK